MDWKQLRMPHAAPRTNNTSHLCRSSSWRTSGEPSNYEGPAVQVNRPSRAARPQSCIEGVTMDKWLQTLEKLQSQSQQRQIPQFVDRTVSMPALPHEITGGNPLSSLQRRRQTSSVSPGLCESSVGSLDSLETDGGADPSDTVHIKPSPSTERAKFCSLAPVHFGWLPIQKHVVLTDISNNGCRHDNSRYQKLKSPITPVLLSTAAKLNGSRTNDREPDKSVRSESVGFSRKTPVKTSYSHLQASVSTNLEGGGNGSQTWNPTSRTVDTDRSTSEINKPPVRDPIYRRGSVPDSGCAPKHSSSISSITITSRKVTRSSSLPDTGRPTQRFPNSMTMSDQPVEPPASLFTHVTPHRKALVVKVTEQRMESKTTPGESAADPDHKGHGHPVVLRRKATIVKIVEQTERYGKGWTDTTKPTQNRHSYTEGLKGDCDNTHFSDPSLLNQPCTVSLQPGTNQWRSNTVHHRSSVSLYLNDPKDRSITVEETDSKKNKSPRRPLSCDASLFNHTDPDANAVTHPTLHNKSTSHTHKTNIDPVSSSKGEEKSQSASSIEGKALDGVIQKSSGIKPLTLLKVPDNAPPSTARSVLELNAAAVIANIKLQTRERQNRNTPREIRTTSHTPAADDGKGNNSVPGSDGRNEASLVQFGCEDILGPLSLREALSIRRPDFIQRSQARVQALERRSQERQRDALQKTLSSPHGPETSCIQHQNENLSKTKDRRVSGKEAHQRPRRSHNLLPEVRKRREEEKRKKEEQKRKLVSRTNRLRAELFKKKLLDQLLQRGNN